MRLATALIAGTTWILSALIPAGAHAADTDHATSESANHMTPLYTVHFGFAEDAVRDEDRRGLRRLADRIATEAGADTPLVVTGYTDDIGPQAYNDALALRRAEAVRAVLSEAGLSADAIETVGRGKKDYVASNETAEGRAMNRRAEVRLRRQDRADAGEGDAMVRIGRYSVVVPAPTQAQANPLAAVRRIRLHAGTVGEAFDALLRGTGWRRAGATATDPAALALFRMPLPSVHREMGPMRLDHALGVLCGPAFELVLDPVHRLASCDLRRRYADFRGEAS